MQVVTAPPVLACSCARPTPEDAFQHSVAVFSGKVVSVKDRKLPRKNGGNYMEHAYTFQVDTAWKGVSGSRITTYFYSDFIAADGSSFASCGAQGLEVGKTYLVYAWKAALAADLSDGQNKLSTNLGYCSRTALLSDATEDLRALGPGTPPAPSGVLWRNGPPALLDALGWIGSLLAWLLDLLN